jgi:hypothetical protein
LVRAVWTFFRTSLPLSLVMVFSSFSMHQFLQLRGLAAHFLGGGGEFLGGRRSAAWPC